MKPLVTLTTDFGTVDGYVGAMKGVLYRDCPGVNVVDITHEIEPQDVEAGAAALWTAGRCFPRGTVHVAVVDPGVGGPRRALIAEHGGQLFVGPDNGLLARAAALADLRSDEPRCWAIDRVPADWSVSPTFHGRDLFARVAARLAAGAPPSEFSSGTIEDPVLLAVPPVEHAAALRSDADANAGARESGALLGVVVHVDRFGNLVTNVTGDDLAALARSAGGGLDQVRVAVERSSLMMPLSIAYGDVEPAHLLCYLGSSNALEIAVRDGSAAAILALGRGASVRCHCVTDATDATWATPTAPDR